jgi:ribosomal protein S18 acetylase RimI-like enzyme
LTERRNFLLVAESKNIPVGFAYASVFRGHPFEATELAGAINGVYVLPECRGKGIGKKLIVECLTKMQTEGVSSVRLTVLSGNETAVRLYEELGFKVFRYGMIKPFKH